MEIPPRTRRRVLVSAVVVGFLGNTSAHAEKSLSPRRAPPRTRKYLRARGEETIIRHQDGPKGEIPPRTRRREGVAFDARSPGGNTSAHAEKRHHRGGVPHQWGKYLRARGEEVAEGHATAAGEEIPPRTRRRGRRGACHCGGGGNTSAHAEKRSPRGMPLRRGRKYLRARGEEVAEGHATAAGEEIPPRTRRRGRRGACHCGGGGNTSAHAEKRSPRGMPLRRGRKYLRARGEETVRPSGASRRAEIPPRTRRRGADPLPHPHEEGNTSAHAEKRGRSSSASSWWRKYLRARGEERPVRRFQDP